MDRTDIPNYSMRLEKAIESIEQCKLLRIQQQRWLCRNYGYCFTDPQHKGKIKWKNHPSGLNLPFGLLYSCQGNNDHEKRVSFKTLLGHKKIENTEIYINLERAIFGGEADQEFHVKVASTP
ncbi:MAG: hypothetical protein QW270_05295 [Candidatus Bathyarchaeia archaeon]